MRTRHASQDGFTGSLIGQCLGDALGSPVEGQHPALCQLYVTSVLRAGRAAEASRGDVPFGQYTDDSQLARELLQSYLARGGFDPADYAARIAAIFAEGRIFGWGRATKEAAERIGRGVPWQRAGAPPPAAGNGSAMRAGPVGLLFHGRPAELVRVARDQGHITHQNPRCAAGSVAIAAAVDLALRGGPIDPAAFCAEIRERVADLDGLVSPGEAAAGQGTAVAKPAAGQGTAVAAPRPAGAAVASDPALAQALGELPRWLALPPEQAVGPIRAAGAVPGQDDGWHGISPFVTGSVLWSLYSFLRSPDDYLETICTAIAVGGDVDTTAAMAGAISGARLGLGALPPDLARRLTDRGTWGLPELVELAARCHALAGRA